MIERIAVTGLVVVLGIGGVVGTAAADEVRQQLNAPMILNLLSQPLESAETAFNKQLKKDAAAPIAKRLDDAEVLADGSVRYGNGTKSVTVTIKNPCPPGDIEHEIAEMRAARQLPGRGRR
jgi:hypothetical protein